MRISYKTNNNVVFFCRYHIVWCVKYRRKVLMGEVESRLKEQLVQTAYENNVEINELLIEEDHVHLIVEVDPQLGVNNFVRVAKGVTSRVLREEFPHLRKQLPTLWTVSYLVATVGGAPLSMIKQYIENQQRSEAKTSKQRWEDYLAGGKPGVQN